MVIVSLLILAAVASLLLWILDHRRERILKIEKSDSSDVIEKPKLVDILRFPIPVWLLSMICTFIWGSLISFVALAKPLLINKYDVSIYDTSIQMSLFFITTVIFSPIFGAVINRFGRNMSFILLASVNLVVCNTLFTYSYVYPSVVLIAMGVSISIVNAALFSAFPNLVNSNQLASAFGLVQGMINFGLALFSLFGGEVIDHYGYFALGIYFYYLSLGGLIVTIIAFFYDKLTDGKLNLPRKVPDEIK